MGDGDGWRRVSADEPCRVCGKSRPCKVSIDGAVAMCKRDGAGSFKTLPGEWYLHRADGGVVRTESKVRRSTQGMSKPSGRQGRPRPGKKPETFPTMAAAIEAAGKRIPGGTHAGTWVYRDSGGNDFMAVARFDVPGDKEIRPVYPTGDGWAVGDPQGPLILYRLDNIRATERVFVFEGEKAADAAAGIGLNATTSAHGADCAKKTDWTPLAGSEVVILPDNDEPGRRYAREVAEILVRLDPPAAVKIVELPNLGAGEDIVEFIGANGGGAKGATTRKEIECLADDQAPTDPNALIGGVVLTCLADVREEEVEWLWKGRIAIGTTTLLSGDPGLGKSFITMYVAACVSAGLPWPDDEHSRAAVGQVILMNTEDTLSNTIVPRLKAAGADMRRVHALEGVTEIDPKTKKPRMQHFTLDRDLPRLEEVLRRTPGVRLVIIDPISAHMGNTDSHNGAEVRGVMAELGMLAARYRVALLVVTHLNKNSAASGINRVAGSGAFVAVARSSWGVVSDPQDRDRRKMLPIKNNLAQDVCGLAYTLEDGRVVWEKEPVKETFNDALADAEAGRGTDRGGEDVAGFLAELIGPGKEPMRVTAIMDDGRAAGFTPYAIRRAAKLLKVRPFRQGYQGPVLWTLDPTFNVPGGGDAHTSREPHARRDDKYGADEKYGELGQESGFLSDSDGPSAHTCRVAGVEKYEDDDSAGEPEPVGREVGEL